MDKDNDGRINSQDLHQALKQVSATIDEEEMSELFQVSDMSGQGVIDYEEFIAAMLDSNRVAKRRDAVRRSFEQLDRDGDGYISVEDLAQVRVAAGTAE
jgi:calcium-dependent protein kinase